MQIEIEDILPVARMGLKLAYNRSDLARKAHFHEWLERLMRDEPYGPAYKVEDLFRNAEVDDLCETNQTAILVAREVAVFASNLIFEPTVYEIIPIWDLKHEDFSPHLPTPYIEGFSEPDDCLEDNEPVGEERKCELGIRRLPFTGSATSFKPRRRRA